MMFKPKAEHAPEVLRRDEWLTVPEAAQLLGVNREWVHQLCQKGHLRKFQAFGRSLIPKEDVLNYLQTRSRRAREKRDKQ